MSTTLQNTRIFLKYLTFSTLGITLFAGEGCLAECPVSLEGKTIRQLAVSGEVELNHQKLILDEGSEEKNMEKQGYLMSAKLDLLKGSIIPPAAPQAADPKHSSMCSYKIHDTENKRHMMLHIKVED